MMAPKGPTGAIPVNKTDYEEIARLSNGGYTAQEISWRMGVNIRTVYRARSAMGIASESHREASRKRMSRKDIEEVQKLARQGESLHSISRVTGFDRKSIRNRIRQNA